MNEETKLPETLDMLLRDVHLLWCGGGSADGCSMEWNSGSAADPERAAYIVTQAISELAMSANDQENIVLQALWCGDGPSDGCSIEWNSGSGADRERAASMLAQAIWDLALHATDQEYAVLQRINDICAELDEGSRRL